MGKAALRPGLAQALVDPLCCQAAADLPARGGSDDAPAAARPEGCAASIRRQAIGDGYANETTP